MFLYAARQGVLFNIKISLKGNEIQLANTFCQISRYFITRNKIVDILQGRPNGIIYLNS